MIWRNKRNYDEKEGKVEKRKSHTHTKKKIRLVEKTKVKEKLGETE